MDGNDFAQLTDTQRATLLDLGKESDGVCGPLKDGSFILSRDRRKLPPVRVHANGTWAAFAWTPFPWEGRS